ncbi:MAG: shikimate dehydrogenase [Bacteroidales bacterium]|nr:shikimate dehydrogenase [Bacteroidales bacterium]
MKRFGLTGYPLGHSFSAGYFAEKFRINGQTDCEYANFPVTSAGLIRSLFADDSALMGLNVTIPYKQQVISYIDELDTTAAEIGAVNVIKAYRAAGKLRLKGFNTDSYGFGASLPEEIVSAPGKALVLGIGGASAAVSHSLMKLGFEVVAVSRNADKSSVTYDLLSREMIGSSKIIVNTTPLGMHPDTGSRPPLDYDSLTPEIFLYDLVYNPTVTEFMREGALRGCRTMNGLRMLQLQADRTWEVWNDDAL